MVKIQTKLKHKILPNKERNQLKNLKLLIETSTKTNKLSKKQKLNQTNSKLNINMCFRQKLSISKYIL